MFVYDGKTIYRDVFSFCNRIYNLEKLRKWEKVRFAIDASFMGEAHTWWNTTLAKAVRLGYIQGSHDSALLRGGLKERFKPPPSQALDRLYQTRYTVADVRSRRSPTDYVAQIQNASKGCAMPDDLILTHVWRNIDIELRQDIPEPLSTDTIDSFQRVLQRQSSNWYDKFPPPESRQQRTLADSIQRAAT
jgi:hypothetical protein